MIFINLFNTKQEALSFRYSPNVLIFNHKGIQLLSGQQSKYVQYTNVPDGIELEDFFPNGIFAVSLCGNQRTDISDKFMIERVYQDDNGISQIEWSLTDLPDLGTGLVYLEVNQLLQGSTEYADTWYSNVFQMTSYQSGSTARIDYRDDVSDTMMSTQLQIFYWNKGKNNTLSTYVEAFTGDTITSQSVYSKYENWDTKRIDRDIAFKFDELFKYAYVYVNLIRCSPFSVFEIPDPVGTENDVRFPFKLSFKYNDIYDPNFVPPLPDTTPRIEFTQIQYSGSNQVVVYYQIYYFEPSQLVVQRSTDGLNWTDSPILDEGGSAIYGLQYPIGTQMQLRIRAPFEDINSNILPFQVEVPNTIAGVTAVFIPAQSRWRITVDYTQSYYNGLNVVMITQRNAQTPIETTETNDGSVSRNILGSPGDLIKVSLRATDNSFQSEIKTITLT